MASLLDQRRSPFDPRFPPDFRWRRAVELVELGRRARRPYDDEPTFRARRHVAALGRCRTERDRARLAAADPDLHATSVVVLTTSNEERDKVDAYQFNVAGYLLKPVTFGNFVDLMVALDKYWTLVEMP